MRTLSHHQRLAWMAAGLMAAAGTVFAGPLTLKGRIMSMGAGPESMDVRIIVHDFAAPADLAELKKVVESKDNIALHRALGTRRAAVLEYLKRMGIEERFALALKDTVNGRVRIRLIQEGRFDPRYKEWATTMVELTLDDGFQGEGRIRSVLVRFDGQGNLDIGEYPLQGVPRPIAFVRPAD